MPEIILTEEEQRIVRDYLVKCCDGSEEAATDFMEDTLKSESLQRDMLQLALDNAKMDGNALIYFVCDYI